MIRRLLLCLVGAACAAAADSASGAIADTTAAGVEIRVSPKIDSFYSPARGIGVGAELGVQNLFYQGSRLSLEGSVMTRHGEYHAFFFSHDPYSSRLYAAAGVTYVGTRAWTFYGLGPRSQTDDAVRLTARRIAVEGRIGWYPLADHGLVIQPVVRLLHANVRSMEEVEEGALDRLSESSIASLGRALAGPSTGVEVGVGIVYDLMDEPRHPSRGLLLQVGSRRYVGLDHQPYRYHTSSAIIHGAIPIIGSRTVAEGRILVHLTRPTNDQAVPFYALPTLDTDITGGYARYRMVGHDMFALSIGLRFPLLDVFNWVGAEAFVAVHAANVYDRLFDQFEPRVSFAEDLGRDNGRAPLRPALTLGGHIVDLGDRLPIVSGQVGISPEGFQLAGLTFTVDLRQRRPYVR